MPNRRTRRRSMRGVDLLVVVGVLAVGACTGDSPGEVTPPTSIRAATTTVAERENDERLVLGVYLPITGAGSDLGVPMVAAVDAAISRINDAGGVLGQPVAVERADEGADTGLGELLSKGVDAIVGPASSLTALSQLGAAVDAGVVVCSPSATSLALDDYPDNGFLFRTVPSDSVQMAAIARRVERTGVTAIAVGYLDDPYGRGLYEAFKASILTRSVDVAPGVELVAEVGFSGDQEDLSEAAKTLLTDDPGVVVVLGDADDGGRLLAALDDATDDPPQVIVNDSIRQARQAIQSLDHAFRARLTGVAPLSRPLGEESAGGFFTAHAVDCVNLIALATILAGSDSPRSIRANIANASNSGQPCTTFEECAARLSENLSIDYNGASGSAALSNATGDPSQARFEVFEFDDDGREINLRSELIQTSSVNDTR